MADNNNKSIRHHCSFCGRGEGEVELLIPSPEGVFICNDCVEVCTQILDDYMPAEAVGEGDSILAWKIPWTEESDELKSIGSQRVRHD